MYQKLLFLIVISFLVTACSVFGPVKTTAINQYTLTAYGAQKIAAKPMSNTLLVNTPIAVAGYQTAQMIYTTDDHLQLRSFAKNQWVAPPVFLLQPLLAQSLRATGYFHAVVVTPQVVLADWRLDTQLLALRQDFFTAGSQICLTLQVQIVNSNTNKVVAQRYFTVVQMAPQRNPQGGVIAANQAAQKISQQISQFVVDTIRKNH